MWQASLYECGDKKVCFRTKAYAPFKLKDGIKIGDNICGEFGFTNPDYQQGGFSYKEYLYGDKISNVGFLKGELKSLDEKHPVLNLLIYTGNVIRERFLKFVDDVFKNKDENAVMKGIMIGDKEDFSEELLKKFSLSGFFYISAVSGFHIMILCLILMFFIKGINKYLRFFIMLIVLSVYLSVSMFTPSATRAVVMACVLTFSVLVMKNPDTLTSLFLAAVILFVVNPYIFYKIGFVLSFTATLSLCLYFSPVSYFKQRFLMKVLKQRPRLMAFLSTGIDYFIVPIAAQILIIPIVMECFNIVSFGGIIGNIIVIPCTVIVFCAGIILFLLHLIYAPLSTIFSFFATIPLKIVLKTIDVLSKMPLAFSYSKDISLLIYVSYYTLCLILYMFLMHRYKLLKEVSLKGE